MKPFKDMRQFIQWLDENHQLIRVKQPVSPDLEMTEVTDRVSKLPDGQNKAILFENVTGFNVPVFMNGFGSEQRMSWALGVDHLEELNDRLGRLIDPRLPKGLGQTLDRGRSLFDALRSAGLKPVRVRRGPVQEVVEQDHPSMDFLPILKCWPKDGGNFITLPQVITRNPQSGVRNVGMYRLQVMDDHTLLVHWQRHKGGAEHEQRARALDQTASPPRLCWVVTLPVCGVLQPLYRPRSMSTCWLGICAGLRWSLSRASRSRSKCRRGLRLCSKATSI